MNNQKGFCSIDAIFVLVGVLFVFMVGLTTYDGIRRMWSSSHTKNEILTEKNLMCENLDNTLYQSNSHTSSQIEVHANPYKE